MLSIVICYEDTQRVVGRTQDVQRTTQVTYKRMIMEYMHDEYWDVLLTLGTFNSRAGPAALEYALRYLGRRLPDAILFQ
jgi:hypothetical protein